MPPLELIDVGPHVLCVRRPRYLSNSYIVHDDRGVVLVDAGMEADGSDMRHGLARIGRRIEDVTAILLTHWHNDHSAGAEELRVQSGARVYYGAEEHAHFTKTAVNGLRMRIADRMPESGVFAALKAVLGQSPPRAIHGGTVISQQQPLEDRFLAIPTPGHSAGHLSFFYEPDRVLFTGDAVAVCGKRLWFMSRFLTENIAQARESMLRCAELDVTAICPGHREPLVANIAAHREKLLHYLRAGNPWPLIS